jgi:ribosomal-protein-alanine N-acetyltransferase
MSAEYTLFAIDAMIEADLAEVVAIEATAFHDPPREPAQSEQRFREELARPWGRAWVARGEGGRAVGYLLLWHVADEVHVLDVAVHPDQRRRGVARALMHRALAFANERGARIVLLEVRRSNIAAIRLYEGLGFSLLNERKRYYPNGEDALELALYVTAR